MKLTFSLIILLLGAVASKAQSHPITAEEYNQASHFAVSETNAAFPFIFTVTTDFIENGKTVSTVTEVDERESPGHERITRTTVNGGKTTRQYQVKVGFGKVFCSDDGTYWKPPSPYECSGPVSFYGPRNPESVEYGVEQKSLDGKDVKVYREYSVFGSSTPNGKKDFRDEVSTIDSRGFFISVVTTEGTLEPKTVTLVRKQSWTTKTKIKPIVAPMK
jgi:hypothetical protein